MEEEFPKLDDESWTHLVEVRGKYVRVSPRALLERDLEGLEVAYSNTQNPIYVWKAILLSLMHAELPDEPDWEPWPNCVPRWCNEYLRSCASAIESMSYGCDDPPGDCAESIPARFGFTRKGWNAFNERRALRQSQWIARFYFERRAEGVSAQQAMNETLERYALQNERSVRRRFATLSRTYTQQAASSPADYKTDPQ